MQASYGWQQLWKMCRLLQRFPMEARFDNRKERMQKWFQFSIALPCEIQSLFSNSMTLKSIHFSSNWRVIFNQMNVLFSGCNCNNHANKCHFDPAVYMASGMISGGVCDDCQHNTMGQHCNECKPHFYPNPYSTMDRPDACIGQFTY